MQQHVICHLRPAVDGCGPQAYSNDMPGYDAVREDDFVDDKGTGQCACQWCCHEFEGTPVGIPVRRTGDTYSTCGQYCSYACAASAIFDEKADTNVAWTRYQMLNDMAGQTTPVPRAPPRAALRLFGGSMSIDEFRAVKGVAVLARYPPTIVENVRLEEVPSHHLYRNTYKPLDEDRVSQYKVRMQRAKPKKSFYT